MTTSEVDKIDDPIRLQIEESERSVREKRIRWQAARPYYGPLVNAMKLLDASLSISYDLDIWLTGNAAKLRAALKIFEEAGLSTIDPKPVPGSATWSAWWNHPVCPTRVYFSFTSNVCRQVQVGTQVVPKYETVCGEIEEATPEELAAATSINLPPPEELLPAPKA